MYCIFVLVLIDLQPRPPKLLARWFVVGLVLISLAVMTLRISVSSSLHLHDACILTKTYVAAGIVHVLCSLFFCAVVSLDDSKLFAFCSIFSLIAAMLVKVSFSVCSRTKYLYDPLILRRSFSLSSMLAVRL